MMKGLPRHHLPLWWENVLTVLVLFDFLTFAKAYGISRTPLLFRYRTVAEVPRSYFVGRRRLYCRIIGVQRNAKSNYSAEGNDKESIQVLVRHLSPIGALLPTSWFESLMRISPSNRNFSQGLVKANAAQESSRELLRLQIAGILPPPLIHDSHDPEEFLERGGGCCRSRPMNSSRSDQPVRKISDCFSDGINDPSSSNPDCPPLETSTCQYTKTPEFGGMALEAFGSKKKTISWIDVNGKGKPPEVDDDDDKTDIVNFVPLDPSTGKKSVSTGAVGAIRPKSGCCCMSCCCCCCCCWATVENTANPLL